MGLCKSKIHPAVSQLPLGEKLIYCTKDTSIFFNKYPYLDVKSTQRKKGCLCNIDAKILFYVSNIIARKYYVKYLKYKQEKELNVLRKLGSKIVNTVRFEECGERHDLCVFRIIILEDMLIVEFIETRENEEVILLQDIIAINELDNIFKIIHQ